MFGWFVRRAERRPMKAWATGVICAVLGLLLVAAFWSGLPPILGIAGMYLGYISYHTRQPRWPRWGGVSALTIGGIAVVTDVAIYVSDISSRL